MNEELIREKLERPECEDCGSKIRSEILTGGEELLCWTHLEERAGEEADTNA